MIFDISGIFGVVVGIIVALFVVIYTYELWLFQYWERMGVPYVKPSFPFGNIGNLLWGKRHLAHMVITCYNELRNRGVKIGGVFFFLKPVLMPVDPTLIKNILIKDFDHFVNRGNYLNENDDPLSAHLFNVEGSRWHTLRNKLSPTFTSGKMKMMFNTLLNCAPNLVKKVEKSISEPLNIKDILECFTTDVIGSCAFGLDCQSFENENAPFRFYGKKLFEPTLFQQLKAFLAASNHTIGKALRIRLIPKDTEKFFMKLVKDTTEYRKKNNIERNDFLQLILNQNNLEFNEIAANCVLFFAAGFETSATTMSFALYYLAKNQDIQDRLRLEIEQTLKNHNNEITYESIFEMKFLGQVIDETLRLCPPVVFLTRQCIKDYRVPESDLIIEKGTSIFIPAYGVHHDKNIYSEPEKFNPDRFNGDKSSRLFLPFGEGPRNCVGLRFGLMQSRVGLVTLLTNYKFTLSAKQREPLEIDPRNFILSAKGGIWLNAEKIMV